jgi:hypothetical protein
LADTRLLHSRRQHQWTLTHGFYASMGGFVIDRQDSGGSCITLTVEGVKHLLKNDPDVIPDISKDSIMDHSKADGVAKALQLVQVSWFCINCACRRAQGLPLSLLEIYTLAHATCMLVVYLIWLKKPLEIREPTIIRGHKIQVSMHLLWATGLLTIVRRPLDCSTIV